MASPKTGAVYRQLQSQGMIGQGISIEGISIINKYSRRVGFALLK